MALTPNYLETLRTRKKESHVYKDFQLAGLELAQILDDKAHKALYIKLAKEGNPQALRELAKSIAEKKDVKHKGAYFMAVFTRDRAKYQLRKPAIKSPKPEKPGKNNGRKDLSKRKPRGRKISPRKNKGV